MQHRDGSFSHAIFESFEIFNFYTANTGKWLAKNFFILKEFVVMVSCNSIILTLLSDRWQILYAVQSRNFSRILGMSGCRWFMVPLPLRELRGPIHTISR